MAGPWRVRFVSHGVLDGLGPGFRDHWDPDILRQAAERLGYLPWIWWSYGREDEPSGVFTVCPWCYHVGSLAFRSSPMDPGRVVWQFNGDAEHPTLAPSVQCVPDRVDPCPMHIWLVRGAISDAGTPPHGPTP